MLFLCRLLQEFVEKHDNGFEVVYTLSGWLKGNPTNYHIKLVSGLKLPGNAFICVVQFMLMYLYLLWCVFVYTRETLLSST